MYLMGFTIDVLSLMALTVATGFVVDDAIVVLENVDAPYRGPAWGASQAALQGTREVAFIVLFMRGRWSRCSPRSSSWAALVGRSSANSP